MINPVELDGEPMIAELDRPEIKLSSTPQIVIAIPCGNKHDNTIIQCPPEQGGCGQKYLMPGTRHPLLVPVRWMLARDKLLKPLNTVTATLVESGRLSAEARQIMTKKAIRMGAKYILYWDDDTMPPPLGLYTMHNWMEQNPEAGAISGVYTTRENPQEPLVYKEHGKGAWWDFPMGDGAEPQRIFGAGAGFLLARVSSIIDVIEKMKEEAGEEIPIWADERMEPGEETTIPVMFGHDIRFCRLLNKYGHPVYVDGRVLCGHLDVERNKIYRMPADPLAEQTKPVELEEAKLNPSVEVFIVDFNQPEYAERTRQAVEAHTQYDNYTLTMSINEPGKSLAKHWNELIEGSDAEYICLLNPDTVPTPGWLTRMMNAMGPDVGAVVPSSNIVFLSQVPTDLDRFEANFDTINNWAANFASSRAGLVSELPTASGMCVVFPRAIWEEAGKFDEEFQLYGEDTEFFWRLANKFGKKILWAQDAYVHHYKAQCTEKALKEGVDIQAIRKESERLVNEKTDLRISHR